MTKHTKNADEKGFDVSEANLQRETDRIVDELFMVLRLKENCTSITFHIRLAFSKEDKVRICSIDWSRG